MSPHLHCTPWAEAGSRGPWVCSVRAAGAGNWGPQECCVRAEAEDRCGRGTGRDTQPPAPPADLAVMSSKTRKNFSEQFEKQSGHFIMEFTDTKQPNGCFSSYGTQVSGVTQHNFICQLLE